jgi:Fic family protein
MHVPLPPEGVRDAMPLLFELLQSESDPAVQAVLGHFVFVFIHPYMDGNGRLARFILNLMLARGGWPWTIVTMTVRNEYIWRHWRRLPWRMTFDLSLA